MLLSKLHPIPIPIPIPRPHLPFPILSHTTHSLTQYPIHQQQPPIPISDTAHLTKLIHHLCVLRRDPDSALNLLHRLGLPPNSLIISSIIHSLCSARRFPEAHHRFLLFISSGHSPDQRTSNVLIARLLDGLLPDRTLAVVNALVSEKTDGFVPSVSNYNRLIDGFCKIGRVGEAHLVLYRMMERGQCPDVVSYTSLIGGYVGIGEVRDAEKVFDEMSEWGVRANALTFSVLMRGVLRKREMEKGKRLLAKVWDVMKGEEEDGEVNNAAFCGLVETLCREGLFREVFGIAEEMPQGKSVLEEFAYGQMIDSLCRFEMYNGAARIVYVMRTRGFTPSMVSYNSIVHGLCNDGDWFRAYQLLEEGVVFGYLPSEFTYTALVEGLCRVHDVDKAKVVLNLMLRKESTDRTRIYNIYLRALCFMKNPTELLNGLVSMLQSGCKPDIATLNTIIKGLCEVGRVGEASQVLDDMVMGKFCAPDGVTYTTIICGLLTVGRVDEAMDFFRNIMPNRGFAPTVVTYNAILRGLFKLGRAPEAMEVFDDMARNKASADCRTYTIVIEGLFESDSVNEAKRIWDSVVWPSGCHDNFVYAAMLKGFCNCDKFNEACDLLYKLADCGVALNNVNYNIVIDYACKLGWKREAYRIVNEMRNNGLTPDAVTWRILNKLHDTL